MASDTLETWIDLIDSNHPQFVDTLAVDRSILKDQHIAHVVGSLPAQTEARIDQQSVKPYVGIDLFYGKDGNVKGLVFVTQTHALIVRVPDNAAQNAVIYYEKKLQENPQDKSKPIPRGKYKGQKQAKILPEKTPYERLRQLLDLNLVAFGMAQISLTLWDTLRERVDGVNLSTIMSDPNPPPARQVPDPNSPTDEDESEETRKNGGKGQRGSRGGRGQRGRGKGDRGGRGGGRGRGRRRSNDDEAGNTTTKPKMIPVKSLPEDEEACWDRDLISPGHIVNHLYPHVSPMNINAVFFGQSKDTDMLPRVAEAISRAWVAHLVANHDRFNSKVQEAPVIKPSRLNDEELTFFAKSMVTAWRVMGEEEAERAIEREDMKQGGTNELVSQSHKKRIRASKLQEIRIRTKDGQEKTLYGRRVFENARAVKLTENELSPSEEDEPKNARPAQNEAPRTKKNGHRQHKFKDMPNGAEEFISGGVGSLDEQRPFDDDDEDAHIEQPLFDMDDLEAVTIYGRAESTRSENARDMFVLRLLEGRAALRGPGFEDCEFIRRVWFPTPAQIAKGKEREENRKKNNPLEKEKEKQRFDWVEDSWGDDPDPEEVVRASRKKVPDSELVDDETEDEETGHDVKTEEIIKVVPGLAGEINESQREVIGRVTASNPKGRTRATLVHGPPGTGKTSTITAAAIRLVKSGDYVWIVAQSNVGISNVAKKLRRIGFDDFVLIVAEEYWSWWEGQYKDLMPYVVRTIHLKSSEKRFLGKRLILCTLASLSNSSVEKRVMYQHAPLRNLIIDEASQIDMTSEFMHLFFKHRYALKNICWFGDPMQLPPYGWSETTKIDDIFTVKHLQANSKMMNISYRLPKPIADFISREVYKIKSMAWDEHPVEEATEAILFVDVPKGEELRETNGTSYMNLMEAELVIQIVELYYHDKVDPETSKPYDYQIITPYEAQRKLVQNMLKSRGIDKEVYNVDSFQGNEAYYIITTLTKTTFSSFLSSINRLNVLLTRCKRGLIVVSKKEFIIRTGGLLRGLWWDNESKDIWKNAKEVSKGYVDLPGSPAPVERPEEESEEEEGSESEDE